MEQASSRTDLSVLATLVPGLDDVLAGGLPIYSCTLLAGGPGTGKTVLAQHILFNFLRHHGGSRALYLTALSESRAKVIRHAQRFRFFDAAAFGEQVVYHDIGARLRGGRLADGINGVMRSVEEYRAELVVIDSFRALRDLAAGPAEFRLFCYDLAERLAGARSTTLLVGEYERDDVARYAEFAIADGILFLDLVEHPEGPERQLRVLKFRGRAADLGRHPFVITEQGVWVLPRGGSPGGAAGPQQGGLPVDEAGQRSPPAATGPPRGSLSLGPPRGRQAAGF